MDVGIIIPDKAIVQGGLVDGQHQDQQGRRLKKPALERAVRHLYSHQRLCLPLTGWRVFPGVAPVPGYNNRYA